MTYEQKFFNLAIRESNTPDHDGSEEIANILLMGMIEQYARSRDEFLREADTFLDIFGDRAEIAIDGILAKQKQEEDGESGVSLNRNQHNEVIECIRKMAIEIVSIDRSKFAQIVEADWDVRHETHANSEQP